MIRGATIGGERKEWRGKRDEEEELWRDETGKKGKHGRKWTDGWGEQQRRGGGGGGIRLNERKHNARAGARSGGSGRSEERSAPYSARVL